MQGEKQNTPNTTTSSFGSLWYSCGTMAA